MRTKYDFSKGIRGKYARKYRQGTNLVLLEPDVQRAFPDAGSVNKALRNLIKLTRKSSRVAVF
jgi:hypothetical protein